MKFQRTSEEDQEKLNELLARDVLGKLTPAQRALADESTE
jgi:hypothetical protein